MRLRKEIDEMKEKDILLIAKISDALAHPARIKIFRYIMQQNKERTKVCNKDLVNYFDYSQATISLSTLKSLQMPVCSRSKRRIAFHTITCIWAPSTIT